MNKKGFTLIELLSVIILLSLLMGIAISGISKINANAKKKSLNTKIKLIESAAIYWGQDNKTLLRQSTCQIVEEGVSTTYQCAKILISHLIEDDYLDEDKTKTENGKIKYIIKDQVNGINMVEKCVFVYKKNNRVYSYYNKTNVC